MCVCVSEGVGECVSECVCVRSRMHVVLSAQPHSATHVVRRDDERSTRDRIADWSTSDFVMTRDLRLILAASESLAPAVCWGCGGCWFAAAALGSEALAVVVAVIVAVVVAAAALNMTVSSS